jgi:hypothetical protein
MEKDCNGMKFQRWQVPVRLIFAGTVHRSQGMTLNRAVIDCRTKFWEHGQLYVALSRVRNPKNLCILLPADDPDSTIRPTVDPDVVEIVNAMSGLLRPVSGGRLIQPDELDPPEMDSECRDQNTSVQLPDTDFDGFNDQPPDPGPADFMDEQLPNSVEVLRSQVSDMFKEIIENPEQLTLNCLSLSLTPNSASSQSKPFCVRSFTAAVKS